MKNKKAKVLALSALLAFSGALVSCDEKGTSNDPNHQGQNLTSQSETTNSSQEAENSEASSQGGEVVSSEGGSEEVSSEGGNEEISSSKTSEEVSSEGNSEDISSSSSEEPIELEEGELARLNLNKNKSTVKDTFIFGDENLSLSYSSTNNATKDEEGFARIYKGDDVTISSNKEFNKISFICTKDNAAEGLANVTTDVGTFSRDELTVTLILNESTTSVTFTVNQSKVQVEQISVWSFEKKVFEGLSLNNASAVYGEEIIDPTINGLEAYPNAEVSYEYFDEAGEKVDSPTTAGKYAVKAIVTDKSGEYEKLELTGELVINKAKVAVPTADETVFTYNGEEQKFEVKEADEYIVENNVQTAAGTYKVKVSLVDEANYEWEDPSFNGELEFVINKQEIALPTIEEQNFVYDGTEHTLVVPESKYYTFSGNKQTDAGEHEVKFELVDSDNYKFKDGKDTLKFTIDPKVVSYSMEDREYVIGQKIFEGLNHDLKEGMSVTYSYFDENGDFLGEGVKPTKPGQYVVKATIINTNSNFKVENKEISANILIKSFPDEGVSLDTVTAVYGEDYTVDLTGKDKISDDSAKNYTIKYFLDGEEIEKPTDAGEYEIKAVFSEEAHEKGYNDLTSTLKITRKVVTLPTVDALTYNGLEQTLLVLNGSKAYKLADGEVNAAKDAGTYKVKLVVVDEKNTKFEDGIVPEVEVVINKAKVELPTVKEGLVYNGSRQELVEENELYTSVYNEAINAGTYEIEVELNDPKNYEWISEFNGKLEATIAKASWDSLSITNASPTSIKVKEGGSFTADDVVITGIKDVNISIIKVNGKDENKVLPGEGEQTYVVSISNDNYDGTKELEGKVTVTQKTKIAAADLEDQKYTVEAGTSKEFDLTALNAKYNGAIAVEGYELDGKAATPNAGGEYVVKLSLANDDYYFENDDNTAKLIISNLKAVESNEELNKLQSVANFYLVANYNGSDLFASTLKSNKTFELDNDSDNAYSVPTSAIKFDLEYAGSENLYYISYVNSDVKNYVSLPTNNSYQLKITTEKVASQVEIIDGKLVVSNGSKVLASASNYDGALEALSPTSANANPVVLYYEYMSDATISNIKKGPAEKALKDLESYLDSSSITEDNYAEVNEKYELAIAEVNNYKEKYFADETSLEGYANLTIVKANLDTYLSSAETYTITIEENEDVSKVEIVGYESLEAFNASKPVKGTEYTIKVTCVDGKIVDLIKVGTQEYALDKDGTCTLTVNGNDTVVIITKEGKLAKDVKLELSASDVDNMSTDGYSYTHKQNAKNPTILDSDKLKLYNANGKGNSITIKVNSSLQGYNIVTSKANKTKNTPKVTIEASTDGKTWVTIVDGESPATFTKDDLGSNGYKIIRITNSSSDTSQLFVSEITLTY